MTSQKSDAAFNEATTARAKVVAQIDSLLSEHREIDAEAEQTLEEINKLRGMYVPPDEMKRMVVEIANAARERWERSVRNSICRFITKMDAEVHDVLAEDRGKPMTFGEIETALKGERESYAVLHFLAAPARVSHDSPLYAAVGDAIGARLMEIMSAITPGDMGYQRVKMEDVGTGMTQRRAAIAALEGKLAALRTRLADVHQKLAALGHSGWPLGQKISAWMMG